MGRTQRLIVVMKPMIRAGLLVLGASLFVGTATAATPHHSPAKHGTPVIRPAPATAPATGRRHHVCTLTGPEPAGRAGHGHGLVWVRRHPDGLVMMWIPGLNSKQCHARRTVARRSRAVRLARALDRAPRVPKGTYSCPNDDGTEVDLYFTYRDGGDEFAEVPLAGCRFLSAPNRAARESTRRISHQLSHAAPHRWQPYL